MALKPQSLSPKIQMKSRISNTVAMRDSKVFRKAKTCSHGLTDKIIVKYELAPRTLVEKDPTI